MNQIDVLTQTHFIRIGNEYGRHVEPRPVERRPLAQLLNDLHHDPLPVALVSGLVSLAQVEAHPLAVLLAQGLHNVQGSLTQGLMLRHKVQDF